jgi:hypothetical protein
MLRNLLLTISIACAFSALGEEPNPFPPLGTRYDAIPDDAKAVVKALKKLQARTEIGINFRDYDSAVSDVYPEVKVFVESTESKDMPELRLVLKNAIDCYLKVRELWSIKIGSDSPAKQYDASILLLTAQPLLWKVASGNISAANALIESPKEDLPKTQQTLIESLTTLDAENTLEAAKRQQTELLEKQNATEKKGGGASADDNSPNELQELLFKEGDHGEGVAGGEFKNSTIGITIQNSRAVKQGSVGLPGDGQVTGFIFENEADAKRTYEALAAQIGRDGKIATGLGESSWGTRTTENNKNDVVFRRDNFVVFIRAQSKNLAELTKRAKTVDVRIKKHIASGK